MQNLAADSTIIGYRKYRDFLRSCLPLLDDPIPLSSTLPNWDKAIAHLDYYSPFREKAPSRDAVLNYPNGPTQMGNILTRSGMFSLLVFRGILFDTGALHDGAPLMFQTLADWKGYLALNKERGEKYFCNSAAYGATNSRRTSNAEAYWKGSDAIVEKVREGTEFLQLAKFIADAKDGKKKTAYPGFGKLCAYLLVVDLVYAGVVAEPTIEALAEAVVWLNKGAGSNLRRLLGINTSRVRQEFIGLYLFLLSDEGLTSEERIRMGFDGFVQEHGLCKHGRFNRVYKN